MAILLLSGAWLILVIAAMTVPSLMWSRDPLEIDVAQRLAPPNWAHPFGTDELGRDLFARTLHGTRYSVGIALVVVSGAALIGVSAGSIGAWYGGLAEWSVMRVADLMMAFPLVILAIALVTALGAGLQNVAIALVLVWWGQYARIARGQVLQLRTREYIEAAIALGASDVWVLRRHILPNLTGTIGAKSVVDLGVAILLVGMMSFIGLGAQPPLPEWGAIIASSRRFLLSYWWYPVLPGIVLFTTVTAINLVGDAFISSTDPRLKTRI